MTAKERRRFFHYLASTPIKIGVLRGRDEAWRGIPPEALRGIRLGRDSARSFWNRRLYGRAYWTRGGGDGSIVLDIGCMLRDNKSMHQIVEVLIHEVCHVAFSTHWVEGKVKHFMRSPKARKWAERRLLLALAREGGIK